MKRSISLSLALAGVLASLAGLAGSPDLAAGGENAPIFFVAAPHWTSRSVPGWG